MSSVTTTETKAAKVLRSLRRTEGARIDDISVETGWQSHSVRAFLTGLRKKGHTVVRSKNEDGSSSYRITGDEAAKGADE